MIYEAKNYTQDGREIQALVPQDASQPLKYFGRGMVKVQLGMVNLTYRILANTLEEAFEKTDAAFKVAVEQWKADQLAASKRIIQPGDVRPGKILSIRPVEALK